MSKLYFVKSKTGNNSLIFSTDHGVYVNNCDLSEIFDDVNCNLAAGETAQSKADEIRASLGSTDYDRADAVQDWARDLNNRNWIKISDDRNIDAIVAENEAQEPFNRDEIVIVFGRAKYMVERDYYEVMDSRPHRIRSMEKLIEATGSQGWLNGGETIIGEYDTLDEARVAMKDLKSYADRFTSSNVPFFEVEPVYLFDVSDELIIDGPECLDVAPYEKDIFAEDDSDDE